MFGCGGSDNDGDAIDPQDKTLQDYLMATIAGENQVVVIDDAAAKTIATINVGAGPAIIIATPDNRKAYTANWGDDTISAIDIQTREVTTISVPSRPFVIAMAPDGKYVYAGLYANRIEKIDTATDSIVATFETDVLPASLFVSPDGRTLYVATTAVDPGTIWAIDTVTGEKVHDAINIGRAPGWITMSPDGAKVFALNFYSDDVSVVDTAAWVVEDTISTGEGSQGVIGNVSPDNRTLYITNLGTGDILAMDTETYEIKAFPVNGRPGGVHFNHDGSRLYATHYGPESLNSEPNSNFLYTGVWGKTDPGYVNAMDPVTGDILYEIKVGPGPTSVVGVRY